MANKFTHVMREIKIYSDVYKLYRHSFCGFKKLISLAKLMSMVNAKKIPGDVVECGVYKGGSASLLAKYLGVERKLWLYDSFEGMPEVSDNDGSAAKLYVGEGAVNISEVIKFIKDNCNNFDLINIKEGQFKDTFREDGPSQIALLHCDADWYNSVYEVLDNFYDQVVKGGVIILDDFGYWEGAKTAFYDFCSNRKIKPLIERVSIDQLYWIKDLESNRDGGVFR